MTVYLSGFALNIDVSQLRKDSLIFLHFSFIHSKQVPLYFSVFIPIYSCRDHHNMEVIQIYTSNLYPFSELLFPNTYWIMANIDGNIMYASYYYDISWTTTNLQNNTMEECRGLRGADNVFSF